MPRNLCLNKHPEDSDADGPGGMLRNFSLEAKFVSLPVDPGIPLPGIYYEEIFQNIILTLDPKRVPGSLFILAKAWNCSKYPPIGWKLSKLHSASAWWDIIQTFKKNACKVLISTWETSSGKG